MLPGMMNPMLSGSGGLLMSDLFKTSLYTSNEGSTVTVNNGLNLSTFGGAVLTRQRLVSGRSTFFDTTSPAAENPLDTAASSVTFSPAHSFGTSGFTLSSSTSSISNDGVGGSYFAWAWRKEATFFNTVTYTGDGSSGRQINHGLTVTPGFIIIHKNTGAIRDPIVWHAGLTSGKYAYISTTDGQVGTGIDKRFGNATAYVAPDTTYFTLGNDSEVNGTSDYTAYVFGNDGLTQKHGSVTLDGSGNGTVTLGWRPQAIIFKWQAAVSAWHQFDALRGTSLTVDVSGTGVETTASTIYPTFASTGFTLTTGGAYAGNTLIYSVWKA